jgi:hypothetical protein
MNEKEKLIKEKRLAEATDRNYVGLDGKFGTILRFLGKPIIEQGSRNYIVTEWKDVYDLEDDEAMPMEDLDAEVVEIGKIFDGLRIGHHIEIKYLKDGAVPVTYQDSIDPRIELTKWEKAEKVLSVYYKGYPVYIEVDGDLITFIPFSEWEDIVNMVYQAAEKIQKSFRQELSAAKKEESKQEKIGFLQRLRDRWGI